MFSKEKGLFAKMSAKPSLLFGSLLIIAGCGPSDAERAAWEQQCRNAGVYDQATLAECRQSGEKARSIASDARRAREIEDQARAQQLAIAEQARERQRRQLTGEQARDDCKRLVASIADKKRTTETGEYQDTWLNIGLPKDGYVTLFQHVLTNPPQSFEYRCAVASDGTVSRPEIRVSPFLDATGGQPVAKYEPIESAQ